MNDLTCSPYLSHPPLTSREKRMLEACISAVGAIWELHDWKDSAEFEGDPDVKKLRAIIAECEQAQGKPAPVTDTHHEFDGGSAA